MNNLIFPLTFLAFNFLEEFYVAYYTCIILSRMQGAFLIEDLLTNVWKRFLNKDDLE